MEDRPVGDEEMANSTVTVTCYVEEGNEEEEGKKGEGLQRAGESLFLRREHGAQPTAHETLAREHLAEQQRGHDQTDDS